MSLAGCSSFLQSALYQTLPSSTCCCSLPLFPPPRKVARKKRESTIASFWNDGSSADACYPFHRRAVLLVAVSVLPFKHLREAAAGQLQKVSEKMATGIQESQATELMKESKIDFWNSTLLAHEIGAQGVGETYLEIKGQGPRAAEKDFETQLSKMNKPEIPYLLGEAQETTGGSSFISFLYGIGIIVGSGVLGALFTASQREKNALESTIDSEKLYQWIIRQHEEGSRITLADIVGYLQNAIDGAAAAAAASPRPPCSLIPSTLLGSSAVDVAPRQSNPPDHSKNSSVFSNALSSPVRRSLQPYHLAQIDECHSAGGGRSNEGGRETNSHDSSMDMHSDTSPTHHSY